jgi:hypothetical protein
MLSNPQFGGSFRIFNGPSSNTPKPTGVSLLEQQSSLHLTAGPFKAFPSDSWSVLTDEDALAVAKNAGADVSITKTSTENQAAIDTFIQTQNLQNPNGGIGYYIKRYQDVFDTENRQHDGSPVPIIDDSNGFFPG